MSAFRGKNLRSGDLAEQLGLLLLQSVTLVAPVPRTEDVGVDVIATLIRNYDARKYIAEDSFLVQIKSSSITDIVFEGDEVKWLSNLHLPLFIASVDRKKYNIKLFSTHSLSDALVENPERKIVTLKLLDNYDGDITGRDEFVDVPIGPPVLEWSLKTLDSNPNFFEDFFKLMKAHITLAKKGVETRRIGWFEMATWKTGKAPVVRGKKINRKYRTDFVDEITEPYFTTSLHNLVFGDDLFSLRSTYRLLETRLDHEGHFHVVDGKRVLKPWTAPITNKLK